MWDGRPDNNTLRIRWDDDGKTSGIEADKVIEADNVVENAPGVGAWGGSCTCPDGQIYQVGDNGDACGSIACVDGTPGVCNRREGAWSFTKVECAPAPQPTPA